MKGLRPARRRVRAQSIVEVAVTFPLLILAGVGGFVARRMIPANAGKLALPPLPVAAVEAVVESPPPPIVPDPTTTTRLIA